MSITGIEPGNQSPAPVVPLDVVSGRYYDSASAVPITGVATLALVADRLYACPFWTGDAGFVAGKIGCNVTVAGAAGKLLRFSVYANRPGGFLADALILDAGTAPADPGVPPVEETATIALALPPRRWVWLALHSDGAPTVTALSAASTSPRGWLNGAAGTKRGVFLYRTLAFGAAPAVFGAITDDSQASAPRVFLVAA